MMTPMRKKDDGTFKQTGKTDAQKVEESKKEPINEPLFSMLAVTIHDIDR